MMKLLKSLSAVTLLAVVGSVNAAPVNFELTGTVDYLDPFYNPYGLVAGQSIFANGTFDDSVLVAGTGTISFADLGNDMTISVGSMTYTDTMDVFGGGDLSLFNGAFDSLNYSTGDGVFDSADIAFFGDIYLVGAWDANSFSVTAVPVPAAVWLFGSGLIGLAGFARRKKA